MPVLSDNLSFMDQKSPWQAKRIANRPTKAETTEDCRFEPASPDTQIEDLSETATAQSEFTIEAGFGVTKPGYPGIAPAREELSGLVFTSHMDERDPRSGRFDRCPACFDLGQRLATEGSAIMAQKDRQHRLPR